MVEQRARPTQEVATERVETQRTPLDTAHRQRDFRIRFDWGATGAAAVVDPTGTAVVVDVLSFTTTLTVAVERGMTVFPFGWKDERAQAYAAERGAVLARGRSLREGVSLSPASVHTLQLQGGPMDVDEVAAFEAEPHHADAVRVRRWDDGGKVAGHDVPGLEHHLPALRTLARAALTV